MRVCFTSIDTSAADGGTPQHPTAGKSDGEKKKVSFFALVEVKKESKSEKRNEFVPQRARFWLTKDPALNVKNGVAIFETNEKYEVVLKRMEQLRRTGCWGEILSSHMVRHFPWMSQAPRSASSI
jgi:hypothetical protein